MIDCFEYATDRDKAIIASIKGDTLEPFKAFVDKYAKLGIYPACFALPADEVLEISIRQMALHATAIDYETKGRAVEWLTDRGYHLDFTE